MICWYCYWGWPEQTRAIYERAAAEIGEHNLDYGPGHIVWADENFDSGNIEFCIREADKYRGDLPDSYLAIAIRALTELLAIPEEIRCCAPREYDGEHPDKFPPPAGIACDQIRK